ncbi:unnamed protein product [Amaranthus hypochondriacus]
MAAVMSTASTPSSVSSGRPLFLIPKNLLIPSSSLSCTISRTRINSRLVITSQVALKSDSSIDSEEEDAKLKSNLEKVGRKIRVKSPLKVYHIPKLPEFELNSDMVGVIKQYVGFWKGKHISPNYPFKVEFVVEIEGRGPVKFVAHLKEDEFEFVDE